MSGRVLDFGDPLIWVYFSSIWAFITGPIHGGGVELRTQSTLILYYIIGMFKLNIKLKGLP